MVSRLPTFSNAAEIHRHANASSNNLQKTEYTHTHIHAHAHTHKNAKRERKRDSEREKEKKEEKRWRTYTLMKRAYFVAISHDKHLFVHRYQKQLGNNAHLFLIIRRILAKMSTDLSSLKTFHTQTSAH